MNQFAFQKKLFSTFKLLLADKQVFEKNPTMTLKTLLKEFKES